MKMNYTVQRRKNLVLNGLIRKNGLLSDEKTKTALHNETKDCGCDISVPIWQFHVCHLLLIAIFISAIYC